jgi:putative ATPase
VIAESENKRAPQVKFSDNPEKKTPDDSRPLADRIRPRTLDEFVGQRTAVGNGTAIYHAINHDHIFSMILWGPPGCGKTTLARIMANETDAHFVQFSAVLSGVKDIRAVIKIAKEQQQAYQKKTVLFVDEIHRFNKSQQDAFLHHVESGLITLVGATTENPSFEVIPALLSRCRVIVLELLTDEDIKTILRRALSDKQNGLGGHLVSLADDALVHLVQIADGDARTALNGLELAVSLTLASANDQPVEITVEDTTRALQKKAMLYDKSGEEHYNLISALHKSLRGSDPDAALYWLTRMLAGGDDPLYIARRMVRFAAEDIGNADPNAMTVALNAMEAFRFLGHPEGDLALSQAALYLATAPKSNRVYTAHKDTARTIKQTGPLPVPLHIRNAPTRLMKNLGYGKDYRYAHDYKDGYTIQDYLPSELNNRRFYHPTDRGYEKIIKQRLDGWRRIKAKQRAKKELKTGKPNDKKDENR